MKNLFIILIFCSIYSCDNRIKPDSIKQIEINEFQKQSDIDSVKGLISNSFQDIWSDLDSTKIEKYYTNDFILLENGIVWNNDSVKSHLNRKLKEVEIYKYKRLNKFDFLKSVHNQNTIWIAYDNYGTWVKGIDTLGSVHWLESVIAKKENGRWKLQQLHSTTVKN
ncbi:MAG: DUF4440 domain-containing protein [Chlorobi bacterium]|nr:DUF4440 domain-containing protein [Chlorobiota bacterium]